MMRATTSLLIIMFSMAYVSTAGAAEKGLSPTAAEKAAMRIIEAEAKTIAWIAYPTTNYAGVEYDGGARYEDGSFSLVYTFNGNSDGTRGFFTQTYKFHKDGRLVGIKDGARSWLFRPFSEWELFRELVKTFFKEDLAQNRPLKNLLDNGDGRSFAVGLLNSKLGS